MLIFVKFLNANPQATVNNLDLILKWLTLRFFDTNPSVLLRGLEYLLTVFAMLAEDGYNMPELEAASFIPYLILKVTFQIFSFFNLFLKF